MYIDDDDLNPHNKKRKPRDLSVFSLADMDEYVALLEAEIVRVREAKKQAYMAQAGNFFKS
jgi:uncharacterized small protein (DUF1192 family)